MKHFLIFVSMFCSLVVMGMEHSGKAMQGYYPYQRPIQPLAKEQTVNRSLSNEESSAELRRKNQEKMRARMLNIKWFTEQRLKEKIPNFKVCYNQRCDFIVVCQKVGSLVLFAQKWLKEDKCIFTFDRENNEDKSCPSNFTLEQCMLTNIKDAIQIFETTLKSKDSL